MSYNSLIATAVLDMPLQDDAADAVVVNNAGTNGTLVGGNSTADLSTTGPTTWLPKALQFDGTADYVDLGDTTVFDGASSLTLMCRVNLSSFAAEGVFLRKWSPSGRCLIFSQDAAASGKVRVGVAQASNNAESIIVETDSVVLTTATWHHVAATWTAGSTPKVYVDGVQAAVTAILSGTVSTLQNISERLSAAARYNGGSPDLFSTGILSEIAGWDDDKIADIAELYAGPEPSNVSGTLGSDGSLTADADDPSNGTITYEWVVVEADGTVVDSGTGATGTADFGATTGLLTLLVRASNDGGYDVGDFATRTASYGSAGDGYYEVATVILSSTSSGLSSDLARDLVSSF